MIGSISFNFELIGYKILLDFLYLIFLQDSLRYYIPTHFTSIENNKGNKGLKEEFLLIPYPKIDDLQLFSSP
jgi:hypothetical protein